jgi:hypothetical protein
MIIQFFVHSVYVNLRGCYEWSSHVSLLSDPSEVEVTLRQRALGLYPEDALGIYGLLGDIDSRCMIACHGGHTAYADALKAAEHLMFVMQKPVTA